MLETEMQTRRHGKRHEVFLEGNGSIECIPWVNGTLHRDNFLSSKALFGGESYPGFQNVTSVTCVTCPFSSECLETFGIFRRRALCFVVSSRLTWPLANPSVVKHVLYIRTGHRVFEGTWRHLHGKREPFMIFACSVLRVTGEENNGKHLFPVWECWVVEVRWQNWHQRVAQHGVDMGFPWSFTHWKNTSRHAAHCSAKLPSWAKLSQAEQRLSFSIPSIPGDKDEADLSVLNLAVFRSLMQSPSHVCWMLKTLRCSVCSTCFASWLYQNLLHRVYRDTHGECHCSVLMCAGCLNNFVSQLCSLCFVRILTVFLWEFHQFLLIDKSTGHLPFGAARAYGEALQPGIAGRALIL